MWVISDFGLKSEDLTSRYAASVTQSAQVQNKFLKDAHLVIQARSEVSRYLDTRLVGRSGTYHLQLDVAPSYIHKRIQESSGSKYSAPAAAPSIATALSVKPAPSYRPSQGLGGSQGKVRLKASYAIQLLMANSLQLSQLLRRILVPPRLNAHQPLVL